MVGRSSSILGAVATLLVLSCGKPATTAPTQGPSESSGNGDALSGAANDSSTTAVALLPGAMPSVPRSDWPRRFEMTLRDDGGLQFIDFEYGTRDHCIVPMDLAATGVIGCPSIARVHRGDDDSLYELVYTYDDQGRMTSFQDGPTAPDTYDWDSEQLEHVHSSSRRYAATDDGFEVRDGDTVIMTAVVEDGRPTRIEHRYPKMNRTLVQTLPWTGTRVGTIDSGGDMLEPSYDCG